MDIPLGLVFCNVLNDGLAMNRQEGRIDWRRHTAPWQSVNRVPSSADIMVHRTSVCFTLHSRS